MDQVIGTISQSKQIHLMPSRDRLQLMECTDLLSLIRGIRDAVTKIQDSHGCVLVGAAGLEPTTPLEFKQGALTAELHAYFRITSYRWNATH